MLKHSKISKKRKMLASTKILVFVLVFVLAAGAGLLICRSSIFQRGEVPAVEEPQPGPIAEEEPDTRVESPLTGLLVEPEMLERRPLAVIIENYTEARPQVGLQEASLIYEALAEGGITRFLAIFWENDVGRLGPVRSARTYYLDWVRELDALVTHAGGSDEALAQIQNEGFENISYLGGGYKYMERDLSKYAPHNVFTDTDRLYQAAADLGYSPKSPFEGFIFKDDAETFGQNVRIVVNYSGPSYQVIWDHDPKDNIYLRSHGTTGAHKDEITGRQYFARNVIVQFVQTIVKPNKRLKMTNIGTGDALVFQDGKAIKATWSKKNAAARTKFFDENDKEIELNRGLTWIEVMPIGRQVTY